MHLDFVCCTHSGTGGTGALTLAAVTDAPQPTDMLGTSGSVMADYVIIEYTDSTRATKLQEERGRAPLNLATNSLSRGPLVTVSSGVVNNSNPAALNFGATAANIRIVFPATAANLRPALPSMHAQSGIANEVYAATNTRMQLDSNSGSLTMTAGRRVYIPTEYSYGKAISTIAVNASSIATTGNVRVSVYEWGNDGQPGALIKEFTASSQIGINTATGIKSLTLTTPFWLPPGWYWFMVQADAAVQLVMSAPAGQSGAGSSNSRDVMYFYKDTTYGAAPSTADTSFSGANSRSAGGQPVIYVK
jgi:hypothetical protein